MKTPASRSGERRLGGVDELLERVGITHGDVGEHLAVDFDTGLVQTVDEATVRHVVQAATGVDALDPQTPELTLLGTTVAECVLTRMQNCLVGGAERTAAIAEVPPSPSS